MKILAVSDVESKYFYDYYSPGKLSGYDLIIACGDLRVSYLEFLVTMADCPLVFVHGNHDDHFKREPEGCVCLDDDIFEYKGVRIMGLGGSFRYRDGKYMYTERQMRRKIRKLRFKLFRKKGIDILVTHAPARHLNDFDTVTHRGFECFNDLLDRYEPKLFVHGHIHRNYGHGIPQKMQHNNTLVVNASDHCNIEIDV
ncbi:MAG: metallophosphoesterase family protein [Ruminococcus sp.]|nr:metallophosphoesterase family protein [Ruminococcus sp.]